MPLNDSAMLVVGMITAGLGLTIAYVDWSSHSARPMAWFLGLLGASMWLNVDDASVVWRSIGIVLNTFTFLAGIEWANRIGAAVRGARRTAATILFRCAQILILAFLILGLIYTIVIKPDAPASDGFVQTTGLEFALFAPLIGTSMLLALIAGMLLASARMDRAERMRLRVLGLAAPFLISGLILDSQVVPFTMSVGILLLISGAIRYLMIQTQLGQFMSQFLSPDVAQLVRAEGVNRVMKRERRVLSVVMCDLRGFTAYARSQDSDRVVTLLEAFYQAVGTAASKYSGTIKDHAGDGVLILVGAPIAHDDHAMQALLLADELIQTVRRVLQEHGVAQQLGLGVGVATGQITVGTIRGAGQLEYVAVGNAVNLAARLSDRAKDGQIICDMRTSESALERNPEFAERLKIISDEAQPLKGFAEPIDTCSVTLLAETPV